MRLPCFWCARPLDEQHEPHMVSKEMHEIVAQFAADAKATQEHPTFTAAIESAIRQRRSFQGSA